MNGEAGAKAMEIIFSKNEENNRKKVMDRVLAFLFLLAPACYGFALQVPSNFESMYLDSASVISSLYEGLKVEKGITFSDFSYSVEYNEESCLLVVCSEKIVQGILVEFFMAFQFKGTVFNHEDFSLTDYEEFEYLHSYFKINRQMIKVQGNFKNKPAEDIGPSLLWYGGEFGVAARFISLEGRSIIFLRGLDFYCNGHNCTSFLLYAIELRDGNPNLEVFKCRSTYPYDFENLYLVEQAFSGKLQIFLPKGDVVLSKSDFESFVLFK